jgi:hypothetical protein
MINTKHVIYWENINICNNILKKYFIQKFLFMKKQFCKKHYSLSLKKSKHIGSSKHDFTKTMKFHNK